MQGVYFAASGCWHLATGPFSVVEETKEVVKSVKRVKSLKRESGSYHFKLHGFWPQASGIGAILSF
jgi:hypothetical protein